MVDAASTQAGTCDLSLLRLAYIQRNGSFPHPDASLIPPVSTYLDQALPLWTPGRTANEPFTLQLTVHYPAQSFSFRPGFWQQVKWGWIQYLSGLLPLSYLLVWFAHAVLHNKARPRRRRRPLSGADDLFRRAARPAACQGQVRGAAEGTSTVSALPWCA